MHIVFSLLLGLLVVATLAPCFTRFAGPAGRRVHLAAAVITVAALACGAAAAIAGWRGGFPVSLDLTRFSPFSFQLSIDRLSGFFLFVVCAISIPAVSYSVHYIEQHYSKERAAWYWALLPLFLLSMVLVVTGGTVFAFFVGWELMTVLSAALIFLEGDSEERRRNIFLYLLTMHAGAALVMSAFLLFAPYSATLDFASIRIAAAAMPGSLKTGIFLLAFFGFGTKAGIVPLHVWLPRTHPIAPTPVSALMSGIMLKTAIYAFIRFAFDFLSGGPPWGGYLVVAAGVVSALLGILYALSETDLKRLLAYSSVENIGIIFLAIGASLIAMHSGAPGVAALALLAALVHTLNHAIFKNLLFLGVGAIHHRTHTLNLNELGGLAKAMPLTSMVFLVGCISIAGLPLLNGFVGEWIAFQSFLGGGQLTDPVPQVVIPLLAGVLALVGGLAAACFVNVYGSAFLGRPRTQSNTEETPVAMLAPLGVLAAACLVIGMVPMVAVRPLSSLTQSLVPGASFEGLRVMSTGMQAVAIFVLVMVVAVTLIRVALRTSATWGCGLPAFTSRMQYTATSFSKPIRTVFASVYRPQRTLESTPAEQPYFPKAIAYRSTRTLSYEKLLYRPIFDFILNTAQQLRRLQTGNIQMYLLYIFLALLSMLLLMRFSG